MTFKSHPHHSVWQLKLRTGSLSKGNACWFTDDSCGFQLLDHILQFLHLWVLMSKPFLFVSQVVSTLRNLERMKDLRNETICGNTRYWEQNYFMLKVVVISPPFSTKGTLFSLQLSEKKELKREEEERWDGRKREERTMLVERKRNEKVRRRAQRGEEEAEGMNNMDIVDKTDVEQMFLFISWRDFCSDFKDWLLSYELMNHRKCFLFLFVEKLMSNSLGKSRF